MEKSTKIAILSLLACAGMLPLYGENLIPNGDFKKFDDRGRAAGWVCTHGGEVVEEGPEDSTVLRLFARRKWPDHYTGGTMTVIRNLKPGKYKLSGITKGPAYALYVVFQFQRNNPKGASSKTYFSREQLKKRADGWSDFSVEFSVPEFSPEASLILEPQHGQPDQYQEIGKLQLEPLQ